MTTTETFVMDGFTFFRRDDLTETGHAIPVVHPKLEPLVCLLSAIVEHYLGVLATVVGLLLTAAGMLLALLLEEVFLAILVGVIGVLAIAVCITYWTLGEPK